MKKRITLSAAIFIILILIVNNLTGSAKMKNIPGWIVPATIVDDDTIPVMHFPVIIINGNEK